MNKILNLNQYIFTLALITFYACKSTKIERTQINGVEYTSVASLGLDNGGKKDVTSKIQAAFNSFENLYFPEGDYLISKSFLGTHNPQSLIITNRSKVRKILFAKNARLVITEDLGFIKTKSSLLKIYTEYGDIDEVIIDGLTVFVDRTKVSKYITGIFAIENNGFELKNLIIKNTSFYNMTGAGIITHASRNEFTNIYTENTGSHGIGALSPYNLGREHYLYIDGHTSVNDNACSIDFSGASDRNDRRLANPQDIWTGVAKNIKSINSQRGIKTAGYWNLTLENVQVINSKNYGFFINKDAPGRTITMKNYSVQGAIKNGFSLSGNTLLIADSIKIIDCGGGMNITGTQYSLKNVEIAGNGEMKIGMRLGRSGSIDNFACSGVKDGYAPIWVQGNDVKLSNGRVFNNDAPYGILVHKSPENVEITNIEFSNLSNKQPDQQDILVLQLKGKLKVENKMRNAPIKINNKSGIKIIRN